MPGHGRTDGWTDAGGAFTVDWPVSKPNIMQQHFEAWTITISRSHILFRHKSIVLLCWFYTFQNFLFFHFIYRGSSVTWLWVTFYDFIQTLALDWVNFLILVRVIIVNLSKSSIFKKNMSDYYIIKPGIAPCNMA